MRERFTTEMKEAMKAGDKRKLGTVRLIQAALKDKDIEARGAGRGQASDEEILALLQKMIKQRQESMAIYEQNGRPELAAGAGGGRGHPSLPAAADGRGRDPSRDRGRDRRDRRRLHEGHGQGRRRRCARNMPGRMDFGKASGLVKEMLPKG